MSLDQLLVIALLCVAIVVLVFLRSNRQLQTAKIVVGTALTVLGCLAAYGGYVYWQGLPRSVTSYEGVSLGMEMKEVRFLKGKASDELIGQKCDDSRACTDVVDWKIWSYGTDNTPEVQIKFYKDKIYSVRSALPPGYEKSSLRHPLSPLLRINSYATRSQITDALGEPTRQVLSDTGAMEIEYRNFNVRFFLKTNALYSMELLDFTTPDASKDVNSYRYATP